MTSTTTDAAARFAAVYALLTAAHEAGDYWVQQDADAGAKGRHGHEGRTACLRHVASYTATQALALGVAGHYLGLRITGRRAAAALAVSAVTHYVADRCAGHWRETDDDAPTLVRFAHRSGKTQWLQRDPGAGPLLDQAWHRSWIAAAAVVAAGRSRA
ncbi:hypothetical protein [Streptomyces erythrochromogenes]|uniref:hypothetical protein n=1 Tax=Streptomyces erythrochromogenes TaxID=285574 RepID=UPI00386B1D39|nr:hypothetical protein OG364_29585 [Streptomyces erythrochromogenes]